MKLESKVAVVTGATGGIGLGIVKLFLKEGARVVLVDLDEGALRSAVKSFDSSQASYVVADVSRGDQMQEVFSETAARYGGLDVFVANAGIEGAVKPLEEYPEDIFEKVLSVNVMGVFLGIKYAVPLLRQRGGGSIIITSSGAGVRAAKKMGAYIASKHATVGLMRVAALEQAEYGIRVNTVNPGPVDTRMMRALEDGNAPGHGDMAQQAIRDSIPMKRYATPQDVAETMLFLASDASRYCTGGLYMVDGGATL